MSWSTLAGYLDAALVGFILGWLGRGLVIGIDKVTHDPPSGGT